MKILAVFILAVTITIANAQFSFFSKTILKTQVYAAAGECGLREGASRDAIRDLKHGIFADDDPNLKCFVDCVLDRLDFFVDGEINVDVINEKVGSIIGMEQLEAAMEKCNDIKGEDNCDTAYQLLKCYYSNKPPVL
ncbi:general odorant-binding protein 56d-like [Teleopsis dalmanni]|uniref:general odorant-binding protein 56d-like n=1 Tax=Teleopsis dalmanni TaxID=139649 RepID=UPI0018CE9864|nr:general odorant-binding protein 56d-like [Teleopsis dalmanni]